MVLVHLDFDWLKGQGFNEVQVGVSGEGSQDPEEWLFVLIVGFGRDIEVLKISLSVEGDLSGFDFSVLLIDFISNQHDGDVITDSGQVLIPLGHVFVGDSGGDVEHEDGGVGTNIVTFSQTTELFLSGSIPQ